MILAAIDIGSNAARLLISEVIEEPGSSPFFSKLNLVRVPLRLGFDVFETQTISEERIKMFIECMKSFRHLMNAYEVDHVTACATSAMRDATNSTEIIDRILQETGINIQVISGDLEANLIYENHVAENMDNSKSYLYIDVGGGSTELSFFSLGILTFKKSFNIGTIRLLKEKVDEQEWMLLKNTVKSLTRGHREVVAIGSGGNINKIFSLSKRKEGRPLEYDLLRDYYRELGAVPVKERITRYSLREDRADVIVPALQIYTNIMRWADAKEIFVPKIGLADGLIQHLYAQLQNQHA